MILKISVADSVSSQFSDVDELLDEQETPIYVLFYNTFNIKFAAKNSAISCIPAISCILTLAKVPFLYWNLGETDQLNMK